MISTDRTDHCKVWKAGYKAGGREDDDHNVFRSHYRRIDSSGKPERKYNHRSLTSGSALTTLAFSLSYLFFKSVFVSWMAFVIEGLMHP